MSSQTHRVQGEVAETGVTRLVHECKEHARAKPAIHELQILHVNKGDHGFWGWCRDMIGQPRTRLLGDWCRKHMLISCHHAWSMFTASNEADCQFRQILEVTDEALQEVRQLCRGLYGRDEHVGLERLVPGHMLLAPVRTDQDSQNPQEGKSTPKFVLFEAWKEA